MKRALVTGTTGQDGSYLAEFLLEKGYECHGVVRRTSSPSTGRIDHLRDRLHLHDGDLLDFGSLCRLVRAVRPHEVYHLGGQTFVKASFDEPEHTGNVTGLATVRMLEAIRQSGVDARFYNAATSELFGSTPPPHTEATPMHPRSPYGVAKLYGYWSTINYRESYGLHASSGLLFNHESSRRGPEFVTRKITIAAARIKHGRQKVLRLGNLDAKRDWGYAGDYVEAMHAMLQLPEPGDYVIATGEMHSVREFVERAFSVVGLPWEKYVEIDEAHKRPAEVDALCGDASKARRVLGWRPRVGFEELVERMVRSDLDLVTRGAL